MEVVFIITPPLPPPFIILPAALVPYLTAYCRKTPEDDWINMIQELQCPDSTNSVVFSLERNRDIGTTSPKA